MARITYTEAREKGFRNPAELLAILASGKNPDGTEFTLPTDVRSSVAATTSLVELWTDNTLLAATANATSAWMDVSARAELRIGRTAAGGTYAFEVDWARANPGAGAADITEVVVVANNTTVVKPVGMAWARFRARNTDAVTAFTAHRTVVSGR